MQRFSRIIYGAAAVGFLLKIWIAGQAIPSMGKAFCLGTDGSLGL